MVVVVVPRDSMWESGVFGISCWESSLWHPKDVYGWFFSGENPYVWICCFMCCQVFIACFKWFYDESFWVLLWFMFLLWCMRILQCLGVSFGWDTPWFLDSGLRLGFEVFCSILRLFLKWFANSFPKRIWKETHKICKGFGKNFLLFWGIKRLKLLANELGMIDASGWSSASCLVRGLRDFPWFSRN